MGQAESHQPIDPSQPPQTLSSRSLAGIASYIKEDASRPKRIVVMTGAGISTSAGIPDFRSPDTGLYSNLQRLNLPSPEAVFDISYFRENPNPFYVLAKELYPGKFYPTIAHAFIALLNEKGLLQMLFTQNIDYLERRAGVPGEKIVEAHGSFATQRCIDCKTEYPDNLMKEAVQEARVPHCLVPQCNGLVKPDIVFFGEQLPERFHQNRHMPAMADLVIVMGTSLSVQPFASLPGFAREGVPRVLMNKEVVGDLGCRLDDVLLIGDCDSGVRKLAEALGWEDELEQLWLEVGGKVKENEAARLREQRLAMSKDEILEEQIKKLTDEVDKTLQLGKDHTEWVNSNLAEEDKREAAKSSTTPDESAPSQGFKEPSPTPAYNENIPINTEKVENEAPAKAPVANSAAILDVTLPQNKPDASTPGSVTDEKKTPSRI